MENEIMERFEEEVVEQATSGGISIKDVLTFGAGAAVGVALIKAIPAGVRAVKKIFGKKQNEVVEEAEYSEVDSNDVTNNE